MSGRGLGCPAPLSSTQLGKHPLGIQGAQAPDPPACRPPWQVPPALGDSLHLCRSTVPLHPQCTSEWPGGAFRTTRAQARGSDFVSLMLCDVLVKRRALAPNSPGLLPQSALASCVTLGKCLHLSEHLL